MPKPVRAFTVFNECDYHALGILRLGELIPTTTKRNIERPQYREGRIIAQPFAPLMYIGRTLGL